MRHGTSLGAFSGLLRPTLSVTCSATGSRRGPEHQASGFVGLSRRQASGRKVSSGLTTATEMTPFCSGCSEMNADGDAMTVRNPGKYATTTAPTVSQASPVFAPGQSAMFTPDPTVNGPWTHTRADIPLFRPMTPTAPSTAGGVPPTTTARPPGAWQNPTSPGNASAPMAAGAGPRMPRARPTPTRPGEDWRNLLADHLMNG